MGRDKELQDDVNSDDIIHSNASMQPSIDSSITTTDTGSLHAVVPNASSDLSNTTTQSTTDTNNANAATTTPFRRRPRLSRYPVTPPLFHTQYVPLSPPPPPGRRLPGGLDTFQNRNTDNNNNTSSFQM